MSTVAKKNEGKYMVHFLTNQAVKWRSFLEILSPILVDGNLDFDENGFTIHGISISQIWVRAELRSEYMDEYYFDVNTVPVVPLPCGISFERMYKKYKGVKQDDIATLRISKSLWPAHIITEYISCNSRTRGILQLQNVERTFLSLPDTEYDQIIDIPSAVLQSVLRTHADEGDHCQFLSIQEQASDKNKNNAIVIIRTANDWDPSGGMITGIGGQMNVACDSTGKPLFRSKKDAKLSDKLDFYRIKSLSMIAKCASLCPIVTLCLKAGDPLILRYEVGDMGTVTFAVAAHVDPSEVSLKDIDPAMYEIKYDEKDLIKQEDSKEKEKEKEQEKEPPRKIKRKKQLKKEDVNASSSNVPSKKPKVDVK